MSCKQSLIQHRRTLSLRRMRAQTVSVITMHLLEQNLQFPATDLVIAVLLLLALFTILLPPTLEPKERPQSASLKMVIILLPPHP